MNANSKPKNKSKKHIIVPLIIVVALAGAGGYYGYKEYTKKNAEVAMSQMSTARTMPLNKTSLSDYIAVSGTLYSNNSQNVYTTQSYPIKEVYVEVGDIVTEGQVLAVLDMSNLDKDIQQAEINLENAKKSATDSNQSITNSIENAEMSVATAELNLAKQQSNYDLMKERYENGTSNELVNAKNNIDSAQIAVDSAQSSVESAQNSVKSAQSSVDAAIREVELKEQELQTNNVLFSVGGISGYELEASEQAVENAKTAVDNANISVDNANFQLDNAIASLDNAIASYDKAVEAYDRAKEALEADLQAAEKDLENTRLSLQNSQNSLTQAQKKVGSVTSTVESQQITLLKLREQRGEAEIVSPISGTVTQVNATVGMTGSGASGGGSSGGALFVVEDMNDLYVSTSIKEFRISDVSIGQAALVTTDATSDKSFKGELTFVAPSASESSGTTNVEFEVKVSLLEVDPILKIGMNAYANIILESREDIYAVPYDAVVEKGESSFIYTVENGVVVEIPVEIGMETDTMSEISSEALKDGMMVFLTPQMVTPGQPYDASMPAGQGRFVTPNGDENISFQMREGAPQDSERPEVRGDRTGGGMSGGPGGGMSGGPGGGMSGGPGGGMSAPIGG